MICLQQFCHIPGWPAEVSAGYPVSYTCGTWLPSIVNISDS